ncbi:MAG: 23S rRNA (guanosine(2251)-2'-O)-methyltransferase RlmB [Alphaproteobacteria bacterium]|nr:23S rRNA (guanosine(2251)-2'-O)-methyltransferase RlmB [Alphaproteobacteria bacterium]
MAIKNNKQYKNNTINKNNSQSVLLYGRHPVTLALTNPKRKIKELYLVKNALDIKILPPNIPIHWSTKEQLDTLVGKDAVHQGVVAQCQLLNSYSIEDLINDTISLKNTLVVLLDQVTDPHNIGAILRSAAAFHASAVIVPEAGSPQETGVLAKSASGALELIPYIRVTNLSRTMDVLKKNGFWCIGLDGYAQHTIYETKLPAKCAIIMGSEGTGLRRLTAENCDDTVKLPMDTRVESLNVSNACAVTLYEWNRQHLAK